jgi:hypothetical protein
MILKLYLDNYQIFLNKLYIQSVLFKFVAHGRAAIRTKLAQLEIHIVDLTAKKDNLIVRDFI